MPGKRGVAVDQDRKGDRRVVNACASRTIGLLGSREALDDGVDSLEMARVRGEGHLNVARTGLAGLGGGEVILDVARSALRVGDQGVERSLALELAEDRCV